MVEHASNSSRNTLEMGGLLNREKSPNSAVFNSKNADFLSSKKSWQKIVSEVQLNLGELQKEQTTYFKQLMHEVMEREKFQINEISQKIENLSTETESLCGSHLIELQEQLKNLKERLIPESEERIRDLNRKLGNLEAIKQKFEQELRALPRKAQVKSVQRSGFASERKKELRETIKELNLNLELKKKVDRENKKAQKDHSVKDSGSLIITEKDVDKSHRKK